MLEKIEAIYEDEHQITLQGCGVTHTLYYADYPKLNRVSAWELAELDLRIKANKVKEELDELNEERKKYLGYVDEYQAIRKRNNGGEENDGE